VFWGTSFVLAAWCGLLTAVACVLRLRCRLGWRTSLLGSLVVLGTLVWMITESLSIPRLISWSMLSAAWGLVFCMAAVVLSWTLRAHRRDSRAWNLRQLGQVLKVMPVEQAVMLGFMALSALVLFAIATTAAPNTWDSLTYHLSRVMHWEQNRSLSFYATAIQRQLSFGPLAEMVLLNLRILAGSDGLANLVQLAAMMGCIIGGSLIAKRQGGGKTGQVFAAFAIITLPMGLLQATSTQTDYVAALWCICFVVFADRLLQDGGSSLAAVMAGAALGLSALTKVTALLFLLPFGLWLALGLASQLRWKVCRPLAIVLSAGVIVIAPHSLRNLGLYQNPWGLTTGPEQGSYTNQEMTASALASNVLRNLGSQLGSPLEGVNYLITAAIAAAHRTVGIDVNDPRTTWPGTQYAVFSYMHEDSEGNPLHVILTVAAIVALYRRATGKQMAYVSCLVAAVLLFSLILRWQPWNSRLLLPLFVLAMPFAAVALANRLPGPRILIPAVLLGAGAIPYLLANPSRPLLGKESVFLTDRLHQYFASVPDDFGAYQAVARAVNESGCADIGMVTRYDGREYLAWVMIRQYTPRARLEHIQVRNASRKFESSFSPCAIIVMNAIPPRRIVFRGHVFVKTVATEALDLFILAPSDH